jgi:predicted DNA-binding protein (UPF0251 family)
MDEPKTVSLDEIKGLLRARVTEADSQRQCAADLHISHAYLSRLLTTALPPGQKVLRAIGYQRIVRYQKKGKVT